MSAGAGGRLPAMDVKLKGVTANTKPSNGQYSKLLCVPLGEIRGWFVQISSAN